MSLLRTSRVVRGWAVLIQVSYGSTNVICKSDCDAICILEEARVLQLTKELISVQIVVEQ